MTGSPDQLRRNLRRNFTLHVVNGAFISLADALTGPALVLTAFVIQLTPSNALIGLLSPMRDAGWFLPQLFISPWVERVRRKVHFYRAMAFARLIAWGVLVACVLAVQEPLALLAVFYACIALSSVLSGLAGLPYLLVTTKVIPADRRGLLFGLRQFTGGALGVLAGGVVAVLLSGQFGILFPANYALVFAFATVMYLIAYAAFSAIQEPPDPIPDRPTPIRDQLERAWRIARHDLQFRHFLLARTATLIGAACIPFLTVYAKRQLGVSDSFIGTLVSVTLASSLISNLVWARLSDRRGNRLVLVITTGMGALFCGLIVLEVGLAVSPGIATGLLVVLYAISGAMNAGSGLANGPLLMEITAPEHRSLYYGLSNTILGVVLLATGLAGVVVDQAGYVALFALCGAAYALALAQIVRLKEPRTLGAAHA